VEEVNVENQKEVNGEEIRVLGRTLARELTAEEVAVVAGGTTSCKCGCADDCDVARL
jgi:hypothetical protein